MRVVAEVAHGVDAGAANDEVIAEAAVERVVAAAPIQRIGQLVAGDRVVAVAAGDVLDADEGIGRDQNRNRPTERIMYQAELLPGAWAPFSPKCTVT